MDDYIAARRKTVTAKRKMLPSYEDGRTRKERSKLRIDRSLNIPLMSSIEYANRVRESIRNHNQEKRKIGLIISAYNEELVLAHTIESAVNAGIPREDIYVVDDCSADLTAYIARSTIGTHNLLTVGRSGKGLALSTIAKNLELTKRYEWLHIADADGEYDEDYFTELYQHLNPKYAAATGYIASLSGSFISNYRALEYTMGMDLIRRFQSLTGLITIIPGPTSVFRSDVFEQLDFKSPSLCEDYDVTLQIHRKKLGKIKFVDTAIARTQDPLTLRDYIRQVTRWNRGGMQLFLRYKLGRRLSKVDAYVGYQMLQNVLFTFMYLIVLPMVTIATMNPLILAMMFISDVAVVLAFTMFAMYRSGRYEIIESFPLSYILRWVQLIIFLQCFIEVFLLRKYRVSDGVWETVERQSQSTQLSASSMSPAK